MPQYEPTTFAFDEFIFNKPKNLEGYKNIQGYSEFSNILETELIVFQFPHSTYNVSAPKLYYNKYLYFPFLFNTESPQEIINTIKKQMATAQRFICIIDVDSIPFYRIASNLDETIKSLRKFYDIKICVCNIWNETQFETYKDFADIFMINDETISSYEDDNMTYKLCASIKNHYPQLLYNLRQLIDSNNTNHEIWYASNQPKPETLPKIFALGADKVITQYLKYKNFDRAFAYFISLYNCSSLKEFRALGKSLFYSYPDNFIFKKNRQNGVKKL